MIICKVCGYENTDDADFCGNCGNYLEWNSERVEPETEPDTEPEPPAEDAVEVDRGLVQRVRELVGLDEDEAREVAASPEVAEQIASTSDEPEEGESATDTADRIRADAAAKAEAEAAAADRARREAEQQLGEQIATADEARQAAEEAEEARREAEERARAEEEEARRLRERLQELEERLSDLPDAEARAEEERAAAARAREEAEAAERARAVARARADAEAEAARAADERAAEAERLLEEAKEEARAEAEAAERARRAAALVAKPASRTPQRKELREAPARAADQDRARSGADDEVGGVTEQQRDQPGPQQPRVREQKPRPKRPRKRTGQPRARPGDLICGRCGTGNDPERNFCRHCGNSLAEAEPAPSPTLWQRIRGLFRRPEPEPVEAGERPMRQAGGGRGLAAKGRGAKRKILGTWFTVMKTVAIAGFALGLVGISISPLRGDVTGWIGDRVQQVKRVIAPEFDPVNALGARATSVVDGHPASHAVDLLNNTWWAEGEEGPGVGAQLFVDLGEPVDIAKVGFLNGAAEDDEFLAQPRAREVHLVFSNGVTLDVTLADDREFQVFDVEGAEGVTSVEVQILSVYPGQEGEELSLTEIELRTRR